MRRTPILALLVLVPVLSLLAACGASGGEQGAGSDQAATTAAENDEPPSTAALADALPTVDDVGNGYEMSEEDLDGEASNDPDEDDDNDGSDPTDQAIIDACPGAEILNELENEDDSSDEITREFSKAGDVSIEVGLDPTPGNFTEETVDKVIEALADCETITTTDEETGGEIELTLEAERNDDYGDFGLELSMSATFELLGQPVSIEFQGVIFSVNGVTASVVATSGFDEDTFEVVEGDYDLVPELATLLDERVSAL